MRQLKFSSPAKTSKKIDAVLSSGSAITGSIRFSITDEIGYHYLTLWQVGDGNIRHVEQFHIDGQYYRAWYGDEETGIDIDLEPDAYEGVIQGSVSSEGVPFEDIRVEIFDHYALYWFDYMRPAVHVNTDSNGEYRLEGFAVGEYSMQYRDVTGRFATIYSASEDEPYRVDSFSLSEQTQVITKTATLTVAGRITGRVNLPVGLSTENYRIQPYHMTDEVASGCSFNPPVESTYACWAVLWQAVNYAGPPVELDEDGAYSLDGLYPGSYRISVQRSSNPSYDNSWTFIQFYPLKHTILAAADIEVAAEAVVGNIDFDLTVQPRQFLPLAAK
jgi:hypothetical protein